MRAKAGVLRRQDPADPVGGVQVIMFRMECALLRTIGVVMITSVVVIMIAITTRPLRSAFFI
jgi:hypothetical protein